MMNTSRPRRFTPLPGTSKNLRHCPKCGKKRFRPYFDELTQEVLDSYGICNREDACGHSEFPWELLGKSEETFGGKRLPAPVKKKREQTEFIDWIHFFRLEGRTPLNDFLEARFGKEEALRVIGRFPTGACVDGGEVFNVHWHIDEESRIHTGKLMQYRLEENEFGKTVLKRHGRMNWVHSFCEPKLEEYTQTLFGLGQLKERPSAPVAVCEGYRTAMTASVYFPSYVWLAVDSCSMLTAYEGTCSLFEPLRRRQVILFPDLGEGLKRWTRGAEVLKSKGFDVTLNSLLDELATDEERKQGLDLEDFLLRFEPDELS